MQNFDVVFFSPVADHLELKYVCGNDGRQKGKDA
jgi:hypothetical protein